VNPIDFSQIPLRDIHLPGAIGWWPPASGWWILAAVLVCAAVLAFLKYRSHFRERAALRALKRTLERLDEGAEPVHCLQQISMIVRRFAMSVSERADAVAGLTGERWLKYLDSRWNRAEFAAGSGRALAVAPYAPPGRVRAAEVALLGSLCVDWVFAQRKQRKQPER
jgi:hypothetical protein